MTSVELQKLEAACSLLIEYARSRLGETVDLDADYVLEVAPGYSTRFIGENLPDGAVSMNSLADATEELAEYLSGEVGPDSHGIIQCSAILRRVGEILWVS